MSKPRAALTFALLTGVIPSVWAQAHPGTPFGARDPVVCASRKAPAKGAPTAAQANAYFRCDNELVNGFLYLVTEIKLEVAPSARAFNILTDTTGIIDPKQPIYNIRGSYAAYSCWNLASANPGQFPPGKSCSRSDVSNATGMCYKDTFGDWHCVMNGQHSWPAPNQAPPGL
jgi:hypothetical protein